MIKSLLKISLASLMGTTIVIVAITWLPQFDSTAPFIKWIVANTQVIQLTGSLAIALSAITAVLLYRRTSSRHREEDAFRRSDSFLKEFTVSLERAHDTFIDHNATKHYPIRDRVIWLTTARMILRAYKIKVAITDSAHLLKASEHEEYWRTHFYQLLYNNDEVLNLNYFQGGERKSSTDPISLESIAVILDFISWKNNDPIDSINGSEMLIDRPELYAGHRGLTDFIMSYERIRNAAIEAEISEDKT